MALKLLNNMLGAQNEVPGHGKAKGMPGNTNQGRFFLWPGSFFFFANP